MLSFESRAGFHRFQSGQPPGAQAAAQPAMKPVDQVQEISSELRARDLPSKRLLGKGLASVAYETELNGERFARKDFIGVPGGIFQKEAAVLVGLKDHKNIVKTYGWTVDKMSCSLVLEYMEEDLLDLLQKRKEYQGRPAGTASANQSELSHSYPFELPEALDIMVQIARGMEFLHMQNILHGDLKTKNILVTHINDGDKNLLSVKVADFGLVRTKSKSMPFVSRQARKLDVVQWKAPEFFENLSDNDETSSESDSNSGKECTGSPGVTDRLLLGADVYSFGVTCSQILTGEDPYPNQNWNKLGARISSDELRPNLPAKLPLLLKDLLLSCWRKIPAQRPTFSDICATLEHPQIMVCYIRTYSESLQL